MTANQAGPSDKAMEAATNVLTPERDWIGRQVLEAAHDPALGLDRSVCLRDVVEALRGGTITWHPDVRAGRRVPPDDAADFIEREFTA